jgi:anti-anti-sigma factor
MMTQREFVSRPMATTNGSGQLQIDLDLATVTVLREAAAVLLSETAEEITIDLAELQFIDAAGLGEIVCLRATLIAAGRQLTLRRPSPRIRRTFALGGLAELLRDSSFGRG